MQLHELKVRKRGEGRRAAQGESTKAELKEEERSPELKEDAKMADESSELRGKAIRSVRARWDAGARGAAV